jgi:hypothetical protein
VGAEGGRGARRAELYFRATRFVFVVLFLAGDSEGEAPNILAKRASL